MRITIISSDIPYPAVHGGRIDIWSRLQAMKSLGVSLQLILWWLPEERLNDDQRKMLRTVADDIIEIPRGHSLTDYLRFPYPPRMYSFMPAKDRIQEIENRVKAFSPDWIWMDLWQGYLLAHHLREVLGVRIAYRSQNVEQTYFAFQAKAASGPRKLVLALNAAGLVRTEKDLRSSVDAVFDISEEDAQFWQDQGEAKASSVLPALYSSTNTPVAGKRTIDLAYVGNLWTPNNREGLEWFANNVLPLIRVRAQNTMRIVFAGASPHSSVVELCRRNDIECIANPPTVTEYYSAATVLINPVLSASGINIKMLDMLSSGKMIVSTAVALRGIPGPLRSFIQAARNEEEFAELCVRSVDEPRFPDPADIQRLLTEHFGQHHVSKALELLRSL